MAERVLVVGAAGFGRECLDVLEAMVVAGEPLEIVGVLDDAPSEANLKRLDARSIPYLGTIGNWLADGDPRVRFVLGIGSPPVRRRLASLLEGSGLVPFTAVHPSATFGANSVPADGAVICAGVAISGNVRFGRYVHVNPNATVGHDAVLHDFVSINPAAVISGEVHVETGTLVGASATVLQGLRVGADALIGAAAVVTKDVPEGVTAKGIPARWETKLSQTEESSA